MFSKFLLEELSFRRLPIDRCLFLLVENGLRVIIILYVDDMLVMGDPALRSTVIARIRDKFPVTGGGADFLGLEIDHDIAHCQLTVRQTGFATALVESTGYAHRNPVTTPLLTDYNNADPGPVQEDKDTL